MLIVRPSEVLGFVHVGDCASAVLRNELYCRSRGAKKLAHVVAVESTHLVNSVGSSAR